MYAFVVITLVVAVFLRTSAKTGLAVGAIVGVLATVVISKAYDGLPCWDGDIFRNILGWPLFVCSK